MWHIEAERPGGLEVDYQLEFGRRLRQSAFRHDWSCENEDAYYEGGAAGSTLAIVHCPSCIRAKLSPGAPGVYEAVWVVVGHSLLGLV